MQVCEQLAACAGATGNDNPAQASNATAKITFMVSSLWPMNELSGYAQFSKLLQAGPPPNSNGASRGRNGPVPEGCEELQGYGETFLKGIKRQADANRGAQEESGDR